MFGYVRFLEISKVLVPLEERRDLIGRSALSFKLNT